MIYEYVIDPSVLYSWAANDRDYAEFLREYGLGTSRVISSFPKKKPSKLRSYLLGSQGDSQSLQGQRYTEMVLKIVESVVQRDVPQNQKGAWSECSLVEHVRAPFDVILSSDPIDTVENITRENMYAKDSIWHHPSQVSIRRTNADLLSAVFNLIRLSSKRIVIVDPYGWTSEAISFISFLIDSMSDRRVCESIPSLTMYYKEKHGSDKTGNASPSAPHVKNQILRGLSKNTIIPQLDIFELREKLGGDVFHNRCIITEHGGVLIGHGIGVTENEDHTDDVTLMNLVLYLKKWKQFVDEIDFEVISRSEVT